MAEQKKQAKLKLNSQTACFLAIEGLGGMIWQQRHDLGHGRIDDPDNTIATGTTKLDELQKSVVQVLKRKFGVIMPNDPEYPKGIPIEELPDPPQGKKWYWPWYYAMKRRIYGAEYRNLICSGCPYSQGKNHYIRNDGRYPCKLICGWHKVTWPQLCCQIEHPSCNTGFRAMDRGKKFDGGYFKHRLTNDIISRIEFIEKLRREYGPHALLRFLKNERRLRQLVLEGKLHYGFEDE